MAGDVDPTKIEEKGKAALFDELMSDKEVRRDTLRALNKKHPEIYVPELAAEDIVVERTKKIQEDFDKYRTEQEQKALERSLAEQKRELKHKHHATDEDLTAVEKLMTERKIADYDTGFEFYRLSKKAAEPTPSVFESKRLTMPPDLKEWSKNPQQMGRKLAEQALFELNQRRNR